MDHELDLVISESSLLSDSIDKRNSPLEDTLDIGGGVCLSPVSTSIQWAGAIGGLEVLPLLLSVPLGIGTQLAATRIQEWMSSRKVRRIRLDGVEIVTTDEVANVISAIAQVLNQKATNGAGVRDQK